MQVIKSFFIAVSMYSKIPVPQFEWKEEDMKYIFCFFPWVGALIGGCIYFWNELCNYCHIGILCRTAVDAAIPLFITGGIHVDGFMDTMDALHSYSPKERKLEILKDSHIGAFAVIMLAVYGLVYLGAFSEVESNVMLKIVCSSFYLFADSSQKRIVKGSLYLQSAACIGFMLFWSPSAGLIVAAAAMIALIYYFCRSKKEFGGITGDTAGYFVLICEVCMIVIAAMLSLWRLR